MANKLRMLQPRKHDEDRYFQLWMGNREIAFIDIRGRHYKRVSLPRVTRTRARRYAIRWFWLLNKLNGIGESMSPEATVFVLGKMKIDTDPFSAVLKEMGWGELQW